MNALRLGAVQFLNAHPLTAYLPEVAPGRFVVDEVLPAACAQGLAEDRYDLALVPAATLIDHPEWDVVPQLSIACRGPVRTVVVASHVPLAELEAIHLDTASRSSVALLRLLLATRGLRPELVPAAHGTGADRVAGRHGALVIGDAAFGLADRFAHVLDLSAEWFAQTGLPMVFAVMAARRGALGPDDVAALHAARDRGLAHLEPLARAFHQARRAAGQPARPEAEYAAYLRQIRFTLDGYDRQGLVEFLARLAGSDDVHVSLLPEPHAPSASLPLTVPARARPMDASALLEHAADGGRLDAAEAMYLYDEAETFALGEAADRRRAALHPEGIVTYIIDRNVNYTNVCTARCKFCNFYAPPGGRDTWMLTREELAQKFAETEALGGIQILLQGGLHPELGIDWYEDFFRWAKRDFPRLRMHALSPTEIVHIAQLESLPIRTVLERLRDAGLDSLPGGGAEILHDEVRHRISPFKNSSAEWLEVMRQAHIIGLKTTATMVFGFQETAEHLITHLLRLRDLQDEAIARGGPGRFTAFITWPFQAEGTRLKLRDDTSPWRYLRVQALARLVLDNIPNLQVSWPTLGPEIGEVGLRFGANDFGSVMIEENVVSKAGAHFMLTAQDIEHHIRQAGFRPARRTMEYELL